MKVEKNGTTVFELKGRSLDAALRLEAALRQAIDDADPKPKSEGYLNEIQASWDKFYADFQKRLAAEQPDLLELAGLNARTVQVRHEKGTLPRAYSEVPHIFSSPEQNPRYFMYVPVDYKGGHYTPVDGVHLDDQQTQHVDNLLFAGGWLGNAPLVTAKKQGVATPADYDPLQNDFASASYRPSGTWKVFMVEGESQRIVEDYERRQAEWKNAVERVSKAIEKIAEMDFPVLKENLPAGEELRASVSYSYGGYLKGKTLMLLSVRMEGKADMWNAGKTVELESNEAYTLTARNGGEYTVKPRRDTYSGKALAALFDAVPKTPDLGDYPQLRANFWFEGTQAEKALGLNGTVPYLREMGGKKLLVYVVSDDEKGSFTPPGAVPLPYSAFKWLEADEQDRNMGITPPPMPQEIKSLGWGLPPLKTDAKPDTKPGTAAPKP